MRTTRTILLFFALHIAFCTAASAGQWKHVTVVDGDTVRIVPTGDTDGFTLRMLGLDTPELHSKCEGEKAKALAAKARLIELTKNGVRIVSDLSKDLYGRYIVRIFDKQGRDLAEVLIAEGHARTYDGKTARKGWC